MCMTTTIVVSRNSSNTERGFPVIGTINEHFWHGKQTSVWLIREVFPPKIKVFVKKKQTNKPTIFSIEGRSSLLLLRISIWAIHDVAPRHVFQARAPSRNSTKYRADDLCGNLICEYFCWMLGDPPFLGRSLPFLILSIILKIKKKSVRGKFWLFLIYFSNRVELVDEYRCARLSKLPVLRLILPELMT